MADNANTANTVRLFTSESVTEGHPDKICDAISDTILDAMLAVDPHSRVAVETVVTTGLVHVVGEVRCDGYVEIPQLVRNKLRDIGFTSSEVGFDGTTCGVTVAIGEQSQEIGAGVDAALEVRNGENTEVEDQNGAGDQGLMFGYATDETPEFMPLPISLAHKLARRLTEVRKEGIVDHLRPDGKTQVTLAYDDGGTPLYIDTIVISTQHDPGITQDWLYTQLLDNVVKPVVEVSNLSNLLGEHFKLLVNPSGSFILGGPMGDAGLTGRKIIVDTYGGAAPHGGGAFSGKDPSKVDRSAAYAARYVAKNIVAAGLAKRCTVQISYAIGVAKPTSILVDTHGTGKVSDEKLTALVRKHFDLRPKGIVQMLDLLRPIYGKTAAYGHFGREEPEFTWEATDKAAALRADAGL